MRFVTDEPLFHYILEELRRYESENRKVTRIIMTQSEFDQFKREIHDFVGNYCTDVHEGMEYWGVEIHVIGVNE